MEEYLDIVDENGNPTGEIIDRTTAHQKGIRHRTAHVWLLRHKNGRIQILLQKRCAAKSSYPGCYDIFQCRSYSCRYRLHSLRFAGTAGRTGYHRSAGGTHLLR